MRILVTRQGDGTYVSSLEPHLLLESLSFASDVSQGQTALQLLQVRRLLEPQATGAAAALLTADDLDELGAILERSRAAATVEEFVGHDITFHLRIVEAVGNPVLSMLLRVLSTRTQRARIVRGTRTERSVEHAHREHEEILRALRARDAALAVSAATVHVAAVEQWLAAGLDEDPSARSTADRRSTKVPSRPPREVRHATGEVRHATGVGPSRPPDLRKPGEEPATRWP